MPMTIDIPTTKSVTFNRYLRNRRKKKALKMNREEYLRCLISTVIELFVPKISNTLRAWHSEKGIKLIVHEIDRAILKECITVDGSPYLEGGEWIVPVNFNTQRALEQAIIFSDIDGNLYSYNDLQSLFA
jgi:hypothetical protein